MNSIYKAFAFFFLIAIATKLSAQTIHKKIPVPNLVGMQYKDAVVKLRKNKLDIGVVIGNDPFIIFDTLIVYKQEPPSINANGDTVFLKRNKEVDLYLTSPNNSIDTLKKSKARIVVRRSKQQ